MILETHSLDERQLEIYENDYVNGGKVLILKVYCIRKDGGTWELPAPQIFNQNAYNNNKEEYDNQVQAFRNDCQGIINDNSSVVFSEIESLKNDIASLKSALDIE